MPRPSPRILFVPIVALLAAALVLFALFSISTYLNLGRSARQAERVLAAQGAAVVSGLAAGLRTGWRFWTWRQESLQGMIHEMSQSSDVAFIVLLNRQGLILAHSDPRFNGRGLQDFKKLTKPLKSDHVVGWFAEEGVYLSGRYIRAEEFSSPGVSHRRGMMPGMQSKMMAPLLPQVIIVGLKTDTYLKSKQDQVFHAWLMAGLLFLVGCGAIYLIFVVQNYRTIDRTLSDLSTYTSGIVSNMPNGLITLDAGGEPAMINRAARDIFGWGDIEERKLSGAKEIKALTDEFLPRLEKADSPVLDHEYLLEKTNGSTVSLAVSADYSPSTDEEGQGVMFLIRDLSQIKSLEEQVRQGEKLAAVGRLAAGVAHEVRNPLSSMRGLARFLARGLDENSREAEYLKVMVDEIDRLNRVVTNLLDFAKPRNPELVDLDLNVVVQHNLDLVADDAKHNNVLLETHLSEKPAMALADKDQAIQAILNMLLNAIEAMPDGGRLTVASESAPEHAVVTIEDTGPGINDEDKSRLFDPFFTTKKEGTGLGLAQVARIMEAHKGHVTIDHGSGGGALFSLYFPKTISGSVEE